MSPKEVRPLSRVKRFRAGTLGWHRLPGKKTVEAEILDTAATTVRL
jgi:hypothetical protein